MPGSSPNSSLCCRTISARSRSAAACWMRVLPNIRWLLEELRVSLFAQELRTPMPVSVKRLYKVWDSMQR